MGPSLFLIFGPIILIWITCLLSTSRQEEAKEQSKYKGNFLSLHRHLLVLLWINLKDLISNVFRKLKIVGHNNLGHPTLFILKDKFFYF